MPTNYTCPVKGSLIETTTTPFIGNYSFYTFNLILSGTATALNVLICLALIISHATHLSKPREQVLIIKIIAFIPAYTSWSYLTLALPSVQAYLLPWRDVAESLALATFFILICEFLAPSASERESFIATLKLPKKKGKENTTQPLVWYRKSWVAVFQFPVVAILVAIVTDITEALGRYCITSNGTQFFHLWSQIFINISTFIIISAILAFFRACKSQLQAQRPMAKLIAFKGVIGITFLINIIFAILKGTSAYQPTDQLNYADITVGIPTLVVVLVLLPFTGLLWWAYPVTPYKIHPQSASSAEAGEHYVPQSYQGGPLGIRAYTAALNPSDVFHGFVFAFELFSSKTKEELAMKTSGWRPSSGNQTLLRPMGRDREREHGSDFSGEGIVMEHVGQNDMRAQKEQRWQERRERREDRRERRELRREGR